MTLIIGVYLLIVFKIGPKLMEKRKAFNLIFYTRLYNFYQISVCSAFFIGSFHPNFRYIWTLAYKCESNDFDELSQQQIQERKTRTFFFAWLFLLVRLSELQETVLFVLRKKQSQVTFLHCYHHIAVIMVSWQYIKYADHERGFFIGTLNATVHIIMYSYYLLSSFPKYQKSVSGAKKVITVIQISQLVLLFFHAVKVMLYCGAPKIYCSQAVNLFFLVLMFVLFYLRNYQQSKKKPE